MTTPTPPLPPPAARHPGPPPAGAYPEAGQGVLALVLGILSVISIPLLGPVAWWLGLFDKRAVDAGRRDPSGRGAAVAGYVLGIVGTVFLGIGLLVLLAFVGFVLVGLLIGVPIALGSDPGPRGFADYGVESGSGVDDADRRGRSGWQPGHATRPRTRPPVSRTGATCCPGSRSSSRPA
ncbi:MAG: DUF4190 domain-containing protein [Kineosporiaceae bacterium]